MSKEQHNIIYLVRHGENRANITGEFSYKKVDYFLTEKGILQAEQTGAYFQDKHISEVYTSPLRRAKQTAGIIAQKLSLPVTILEQFRELNVGELEDRPPTAENWRVHDRIVQDWFEGKHSESFPGGEDYDSLLARMRNGLLEVTRNKTGKHIVIVGHGGIFTHTLKDICPTADMDIVTRHENYNCSISKIALCTTGDHVAGRLLQWASIEHLHEEAAQVVPGITLVKTIPTTKQM